MSESQSDCIFCQIMAGNIPSTKVYEDDDTYAFMDIAPATEGHVLVVPKVHAKDLLEIDPESLAAVARTAQKVAGRVVETLGADGVSLINSCGAAAWQTVFHLHMHVIPRYIDKAKDTMQLPWVPRQGDLDAIRATGEKLAF
ncbi:MAG: HIT family protein [Nocardioides sp.]|nr:HIT family protein [Nocardioides sp.]